GVRPSIPDTLPRDWRVHDSSALFHPLVPKEVFTDATDWPANNLQQWGVVDHFGLCERIRLGYDLPWNTIPGDRDHLSRKGPNAPGGKYAWSTLSCPVVLLRLFAPRIRFVLLLAAILRHDGIWVGREHVVGDC